MKLFQNAWALAVLAVVIYALTLAGLFVSGGSALFETKQPTHEYEAFDPTSEYYTWNFRTHEINKLIENLNMEREKVRQSEEEIALMSSRVNAEMKELTRVKTEIQQYREELSKYLIEVQDSELKNLKTEVAVYANMEPDSVVAIFDEKTDEEVVKLLALMKPDAIAPIIETMMNKEGGAVPSAKRASRILLKLQRFKEISSKQ
ncbi:MAG: hypothetical protein JW739_03585 [Opitutales bacterium]|nr:hypothetical protein [Opitutales bacterium]